MGGCNGSVSKDTEIDLFLQKHHKLGQVYTDKNCYEVSQQHWDPKKANMILKQQAGDFLLDDEANQRLKEKMEQNRINTGQDISQQELQMLEMCCELVNSNNYKSEGANKILMGSLDYDIENIKCTPIEETTELYLQGDYGTGGRPLLKKVVNPYLEIDLIDPSDPILFQGELQKYKPGFNGVFIDRWVQVTRKAVRYFANKPGSQLAAGKPLMAFPMIAIKSIERIDFDIQLKKTDKKGKEYQKNMFEIFLRDDFLDLFLRPDYEQFFAPDTRRRNHFLQQVQKEQKVVRGSPSKLNIKELYHADEENKAEEPLKQAAMASLNTHSGAWSNRQGMWGLSERKMIFSCKKEIVTQQWMENLMAVFNDVCKPDELEDGENSNEIDNIFDGPNPIEDINNINNGNGTIQNLSLSYEESSRAF